MPYKSNQDLPDGVKNSLPEPAQSMWRNVFNSVSEKGGTEEDSIKQAWGAVKNAGYEKNSDGMWVKMGDSVTTGYMQTGDNTWTPEFNPTVTTTTGPVTYINASETPEFKGYLFNEAETGDVQEIQVVPLGTYHHQLYGKVEVTDEKCKIALDYYNDPRTQKEIQANFNHNEENNAGWLKKLYHKAGQGLFAMVKRGKKLISEHENGNFRFISPEIIFNGINKLTGKKLPMRIAGVAYVNRPFFENMKPVVPFGDDQTQTWFFTDDAEEGIKKDNVIEKPNLKEIERKVQMESLIKKFNDAGYKFSEGAASVEIFNMFKEQEIELKKFKDEAEKNEKAISESTEKIETLGKVVDEYKAKFAEFEAEKKEAEDKKFADDKVALFAELIKDGKLKQADQESWEARIDKKPEMFGEIAELLRALPASNNEPVGTKEAIPTEYSDAKFSELVKQELDANADKVNDGEYTVLDAHEAVYNKFPKFLETEE